MSGIIPTHSHPVGKSHSTGDLREKQLWETPKEKNSITKRVSSLAITPNDKSTPSYNRKKSDFSFITNNNDTPRTHALKELKKEVIQQTNELKTQLTKQEKETNELKTQLITQKKITNELTVKAQIQEKETEELKEKLKKTKKENKRMSKEITECADNHFHQQIMNQKLENTLHSQKETLDEHEKILIQQKDQTEKHEIFIHNQQNTNQNQQLVNNHQYHVNDALLRSAQEQQRKNFENDCRAQATEVQVSVLHARVEEATGQDHEDAKKRPIPDGLYN